MSPLSRLSVNLPASATLQYSAAIKKLQAAGKQVFNLTVGDFDPGILPIPIELKKEVMKAYAEDYTMYPAAEGNADLRQAISLFEREWNGINYGPNEVQVGSGGRALIYAAFRALVDPGDVVVYGLPAWNSNYYTVLAGGVPIEINTLAEDGFLLTSRMVKPYLWKARLLCLCSPQNPTGTAYTKNDLLAICNLVVNENSRRGPGEKKLYILFDGMYGLLTARVSQLANPLSLCPAVRPYLIMVNAVSKIFAATGLRVGWCLGPSDILLHMKNILGYMGAWAPMAEQKATARYLPQSTAVSQYLKAFRRELFYRLHYLYQQIRVLQAKGYPVDAIAPDGGLFLAVKIEIIGAVKAGKSLANATDIAAYLLEKAGIGLLPFSAFGTRRHLPWFRLSVGTCRKEDLPQIIQRLQKALEPFRVPITVNT